MRYISAEELLMLHARVVDATGGSHGVRDVGLLQAIIVKPSAQFGGNELYPSIFKKAAVLLEAIANYHVFVDGNKRTAFMAAAYFLHINGYELVATNKAVEKTVLAVATKHMNLAALEAWIGKHTEKAV